MSELIREMDDIIETEKLNPTSESLALSIDYTKAFDRKPIATIIEALKLFNLSKYFCFLGQGDPQWTHSKF